MLRRWGAVFILVALVLMSCSDGRTAAPGATTVRFEPPVATETAGDSVEAWARGLCTALGSWEVAVGALASEAANQPVPADAEDARAEALVFLDAVGLETDGLRRAVLALGAPDIADGVPIATEIDRSIGELARELARVRGLVAAAPIGDAVALAGAIDGAQAGLQEAREQLETDLASLDRRFDTGELSRILSRTPACLGLTEG